MKKIKSIEKGTGENSTFLCVQDAYRHALFGNRIHEIEEEKKPIKWDRDGILREVLVYRGYSEDGKLLFEVESDSSLTIIYSNEPIKGGEN